MSQTDTKAIERLWDTLTPKLFGYLINTLHDRALAEDILQTTWLKAIGALPGYEERNVGMGAWLFTIARNECRDHWRKAGREVSLDIAVHDTPNNDRKTSEEKLAVEQALEKLSKDDRELLRLRYIADLSTKEIAAVLKINFVTARVRIHRALAHARVILNT